MSFAIRNPLASDRGTAALEFAMIAVPFFLLVIGTMQVAIYMFVSQSLDRTTDLVARAAMVGNVPAGCPATLPTSVASQVPPELNSQLLEVCVSESTSSTQTTINVTSRYPFQSFVASLTGMNAAITSQATLNY